jgi:hypothetical protein
MTKTDKLFFSLLRTALSGEPFQETITDDEWRQIYAMAKRQSVAGMLYPIVSNHHLPMDIAMQWMTDAEVIKGMNQLQNAEAARLTQLFASHNCQTAILKGQANARLYRDKLSRQSGDIDLWVSGGRTRVIEKLKEMHLIEELAATSVEGEATASYHHVHLPPNGHGIIVEVHFRPASGNHNPFTNRRLQRWLEQEIPHTTSVEEGFQVPSIRFALMMQLAHIQRHFLAGGIGMRQVCDYYWLLVNATPEDRQEVSSHLNQFGLLHTAQALMWLLSETLHLQAPLLLCTPDPKRGTWLLREILAGGNFGRYATHRQYGTLRRVLESHLRQLHLLRFDAPETLWLEIDYWKSVITTIPTRLKYRTLSLADVHK